MLDATSQLGYDPADGNPVIEIDASGMGSGTSILNLRTNDSTIKGFAVHGSPDEGIEMDGSTGFGDNNTIQGNWIGLDATGAVRGNAQIGILMAVDADGRHFAHGRAD